MRTVGEVLSNWFIEWLIDWLIDQLIDWHVVCHSQAPSSPGDAWWIKWREWASWCDNWSYWTWSRWFWCGRCVASGTQGNVQTTHHVQIYLISYWTSDNLESLLSCKHKYLANRPLSFLIPYESNVVRSHEQTTRAPANQLTYLPPTSIKSELDTMRHSVGCCPLDKISLNNSITEHPYCTKFTCKPLCTSKP